MGTRGYCAINAILCAALWGAAPVVRADEARACHPPPQELARIMPQVLSATREMLAAHHPDEPNHPAYAPDQFLCDVSTGMVTAMLQRLGAQPGRDYEVTAANSHVFVYLPQEYTVADPTAAQLFAQGSPAHAQMLASGGYVGDREHLMQYMDAHERDIDFTKFPGLRITQDCATNPNLDAAGRKECWELHSADYHQALNTNHWGNQIAPYTGGKLSTDVHNRAAGGLFGRVLTSEKDTLRDLDDPQSERGRRYREIFARLQANLCPPAKPVRAHTPGVASPGCDLDQPAGMEPAKKVVSEVSPPIQAILRGSPRYRQLPP